MKINEIIKFLSLPYLIFKKFVSLFSRGKKDDMNIDNSNLGVETKNFSDNALKETQAILPFVTNKKPTITNSNFKLPPIKFGLSISQYLIKLVLSLYSDNHYLQQQ